MSASPSPAAGGDAKPDQIHFRFCRECSNLLYPKEDRATNQLMFTCRTCHVGEPATSHCVYQNKLNSQVGDTAGVTQDVGSDPTVRFPGFLSINSFCHLCGDELTCHLCGEMPESHLEEDDDSTEWSFASYCSSSPSSSSTHS
ncbi:hypothetical protein N7490_011014 [Penicillium lividum]|nr:hypothetical protein N7490_011014 [Penicillium lividum]